MDEEAIRHGFSHRLRAARLARGWTQVVLAARAGLHTVYVARLEAARQVPSVTTLMRLASALGIEPGALLPSVRARSRRRFP